MMIRKLFFLSALILCSEIAYAQDTPGSRQSNQINLYGIAFDFFDDIQSVHLHAGDKDLGELKLRKSVLGAPLTIGSRSFAFGVFKGESFQRLGEVNLPETGRDFVLVFLPTRDGYRVFPVAADDPSFRSNDSLVFNLTKYPIGVILGTGKQEVRPLDRGKITPGANPGDSHYRASFFYQKDGETILFSNTRWPVYENLKLLVFVYENPQNNRLSYRSVTVLSAE